MQDDLLVLQFVLALQLGVGDGHPLGEASPELRQHQALADVLLEVRGRHWRVLGAQQRDISLLADEVAVLLEAGDGHDLGLDFVIGHRDAHLLGFRDLGVFLDHLLQDLLGHLHLLKDGVAQAAAVGGPVGAHLRLIAAAEVRQADGAGAHAGYPVGAAGGGRVPRFEETGNIEEDEGNNDQGQAPLEPAFVPPHPIEHRHCVKNPSVKVV